jgi:hypothetical protein
MFGGLVFPFSVSDLYEGKPATNLRLQRSTKESEYDGLIIEDTWIRLIVEAAMRGKLQSQIKPNGVPIPIQVIPADRYRPLQERAVFAHCGIADERV